MAIKTISKLDWRKNRNLFLKVILFGIILGGFYWFQFRPAQIKHDCSWMEERSESIPAKPAMTETELRDKGMIQDCTKDSDSPNMFIRMNKVACEQTNQQLIDEYKSPRDAVPSKSSWRRAASYEYQFCLHDKGL